jgi:uncharacterized paraquat-inducible protein A
MSFKFTIEMQANIAKAKARAKANAKISKHTVEYAIVDPLVDKNINEKPKKRFCLECDSKFMSQWAGNRICPLCASYRRNRMNTLLKKGDASGI